MLCALCFVVGYMIFRAQTLSKLSRLVKKNYGHLDSYKYYRGFERALQ